LTGASPIDGVVACRGGAFADVIVFDIGGAWYGLDSVDGATP